MDPLRFLGVGFQYRGEEHPVLAGVDLSCAAGTTTALTGPSGCGKSTLCAIASGIIPRVYDGTLTGRVLLGGEPLPWDRPADVARRLGVVFQNPETQLFLPYVEDELAFAPENFCLARPEIDARITEALAAVGIESLRHHRVHELSGGQKQLVAVAAVLTLRPDILVLDEVMSQLDEGATERMHALIRRLGERGHTILMVEHDEDNLVLADRVLALRDGTLAPIEKREVSR